LLLASVPKISKAGVEVAACGLVWIPRAGLIHARNSSADGQ